MTGAQELRGHLGRVGVWSFALDGLRAEVEREVAAEIESLGVPALWIPEGLGSKEIFSHASLLLNATSRMVVASGIANIWARDPAAMTAGADTLDDVSAGRFLLGIGVSHAPSVARRGGQYAKPYSRMREYLDQMDRAPRAPKDPVARPPRMLAALGPRMLELAAERALGAHPYFVPVEHTAFARERLGPEALLCVEQTAVLETDTTKARAAARQFAGHYLQAENYANNLRRLGWSDEDIAPDYGGSDRLIDAVVARGDVDAIVRRVREHHDAGADHVCVQVVGEDPDDVCLPELRELAPALLGL